MQDHFYSVPRASGGVCYLCARSLRGEEGDSGKVWSRAPLKWGWWASCHCARKIQACAYSTNLEETFITQVRTIIMSTIEFSTSVTPLSHRFCSSYVCSASSSSSSCSSLRPPSPPLVVSL